MYRKYNILALAFVFALGATGCTSKRMEGDEADVEASTDDGLETADATENNADLDVAGTDAGAGGDLPPADDLAPGEDLPADPGAVAGAPADVAPGDISEAPPADAPTDLAADAPTPTGDVPPADIASTPEPMADPTVPTPEPSSGESAAPVSMSLKKITAQPYRSGKILVNAAYVARKGDSPEAISQKVFGTASRVKELCKVNSYNCSRPLKVGDKFYYNSPQRPTDDSAIKMFYEDAGIQPETYVAKAGDNIRKVGKKLLGDGRSWMELWATNPIETKGTMDEGAELKYWPNSEVAAPAVAQAEAGPPAEVAGGEPPPNGAPPPPPEMDVAANAPPPGDPGLPADVGQPPPPPPSDLPPAPSADPNQAAAAASGMVEPPPPPPPPPPTEAPHAGGDMAAMDGSDPNQTMALGVGAVLLLAAAALFISIRKKRQRRQIDYTATQTQIDG